MSDVYCSARLRSWHLCFALRDFEDTKSFIKDMDKYNRRFLTVAYSRGYYSVDSNLTSGTINGGRSALPCRAS